GPCQHQLKRHRQPAESRLTSRHGMSATRTPDPAAWPHQPPHPPPESRSPDRRHPPATYSQPESSRHQTWGGARNDHARGAPPSTVECSFTSSKSRELPAQTPEPKPPR